MSPPLDCLGHLLAYSTPHRLTEVESWQQHIPFAFALVAAARPGVFVELGTHRGDSYCGFCQAVDALGLETRCFAVDTWKGDEHSGRYGDEVLAELRAHHDPRYGRFSSLLRATFDEARDRFADGSIDLLHIDGLHTEEAVRHDYEHWRPKLSPRGVVLFHDVAVREHGFGVWRFWEQVRVQHPSFEFAHGHGLGLLAVGPQAPPEILRLCASPPEDRARLLVFFQALGERTLNGGRVERLSRQEAELRREIDRRGSALASEAERVESLRVALAHGAQSLASLERSLREERERSQALAVDVSEYANSRSWRATAPLRRMVHLARRVKGIASRTLGRGTVEQAMGRIRASSLFDPDWYLRTYPDVAATGIDPLFHYVQFGASEGRRPGPRFDSAAYLAAHPELSRAGLNPLLHFLEQGSASLTRYPEEVRKARAALATGAANATWYGGERLAAKTATLDPAARRLIDAWADRIDASDTAAILAHVGAGPEAATHGGAPSVLARSLAPLAEIEQHLAAIRPGPHAPRSGPPSFSLVTPFFRHLRYFEACAASVERTFARAAGRPVEWIVVNDDPAVGVDELRRALPEALRGVTRVLSDGRNAGVVERLNQAIDLAQHEWILFLDCDDLIASDAVPVLEAYIGRFPACRYISSATIDIDEDGRVLRQRRRTAGPARLMSDGMTAGHLKAIRRDAFQDHGPLDLAFPGCQDYDFALRIAFREPLLYIPEYLYSYRWHRGSQSVARASAQTATADAVVRHHALRFLRARSATGGRETPGLALANRSALAIIRTQGRRPDLLEEAVRSVLLQDVPTTPLVVVHGDERMLGEVKAQAARIGPSVEVLHAPDTTRKRAYPINCALRGALQSQAEPGILFFLDDDDIVYPMFTRQMCDALEVSGADLAHAASNKRIPWNPAEPGYRPVPAPCLFVGNTVPINSYALRFSRWKEAPVFFDEDLTYLEDWDFLLRTLGSGLRFLPLRDTLSEFRVIGDGNRTTKQHPAEWARCEAMVRSSADAAIHALGRDRLLEQFLTFPGDWLSDLSPDEAARVIQARALVESRCPPTPVSGAPTRAVSGAPA